MASVLFVVGCHRFSKLACLFLAKVLEKVKVIFFSASVLVAKYAHYFSSRVMAS